MELVQRFLQRFLLAEMETKLLEEVSNQLLQDGFVGKIDNQANFKVLIEIFHS